MLVKSILATCGEIQQQQNIPIAATESIYNTKQSNTHLFAIVLRAKGWHGVRMAHSRIPTQKRWSAVLPRKMRLDNFKSQARLTAFGVNRLKNVHHIRRNTILSVRFVVVVIAVVGVVGLVAITPTKQTVPLAMSHILLIARLPTEKVSSNGVT